MTFEARGFGVVAGEGKFRDANVVKALWIGFEGCGAVTVGTFFYRRSLGELARVFVFVAAFTFAWRATECRSVAGFRAGTMAACARGFFVGTFEWPGRVVDLRLVPIARAVTVSAAAVGHFFRELGAVRIFVTFGALPLNNFERYARPRRAMAATAWRSDVFAIQHECSGFVFQGAKHRRGKTANVVTLRAFTGAASRELAIVLIFVTRRARVKRQLAVAGVFRQRLEMAFGARSINVFAL